MNIWIVILFIWVIGLAIAFIAGISQDIKSAKFKDIYPPPTKRSVIPLMLNGVFQIIAGILMLSINKEMTGSTGFGIVYLIGGTAILIYCLFKLKKIKKSNQKEED